MGPPGLHIQNAEGAEEATFQARLHLTRGGREAQGMDWRDTHLDGLYTPRVARAKKEKGKTSEL